MGGEPARRTAVFRPYEQVRLAVAISFPACFLHSSGTPRRALTMARRVMVDMKQA
jgi:hypothetical protein